MRIAFDAMQTGNAAWTGAEGRRLRAARELKGHTQADCVIELDRLGAKVAQPTISRWESNSQRPGNAARAAIELYCAPVDDIATASLAGVRLHDDEGGDELDELFRNVMRSGLAGTPELREAQLIDALIERLRAGPAMSQTDGLALKFLAGLLGIEA